MVMEEIEMELEKDGRSVHPKAFRDKYRSNKKSITQLDTSLDGKIRKLHIVELKSPMQIIFYPNLYKNIHYSLCSIKEYEELLFKASGKNVDVKFYDKSTNHVCADSENIIVLNDGFDTNAILDQVNFDLMKETIDKGIMDSKRNTQGYGAGATGQCANAWRYPHAHLHKFAKNHVLCKEGFCNNIPTCIRRNIGKALNVLGDKLVEICGINNIKIFHDDARQLEYSKEFEEQLNVTCRVWFEQVTLKKSLGHVLPHIDVENCHILGYNYSGVMAITKGND